MQAAVAADGFDPVFASYLASLPRLRGRPDADTRAPAVFAAAWDALKLRPEPRRTVLVTGSKGKGTAARLVAWHLQRAGHRVGLVVSPEELGHLDRMRIGNVPITQADFDRHLQAVLPLLQRLLAERAPDRYLSPTGIFLTVALAWLREQGVDWTVIEGGRGVRADEIGQLRGHAGIVTTVLPEHVAALGGSLRDVLADKLALAGQVDMCFAGPQVARALAAAGAANSADAANAANAAVVAVPRNLRMAQALPRDAMLPRWHAELCGAAAQALRACGVPGDFTPMPTPSFWRGTFQDRTVVCEPVVSGDSLDGDFLRAQFPQGASVVLGLSDDKDVASVVQRLRALGFTRLYALALGSAAGHVSSRWIAGNAWGVVPLGTLDVVRPDLDALGAALRRVPGPVYAAGVQLFARSLRRALGLPLAAPDATPAADRQSTGGHPEQPT